MEGMVKAIIWASPRTRSTALLTSLSGIPNCKVFLELYSIAYHFGPERLEKFPYVEDIPAETDRRDDDKSKVEQGYAFQSSICTYDWVKEILQQDYPGKKIVFTKEMTFCLNQNYESLPDGYRHIFLIRNPGQLFPSWKQLSEDFKGSTSDTEESVPCLDAEKRFLDSLPSGMAYKETFDLLGYVKEKQLDEHPIIIDADDLVSNPAGVLSTLCSKLGVPYSDSLLTWDKGAGVVDSWTLGNQFKWFIKNAKSFEKLRNSTGFLASPVSVPTCTGEAKVTANIQHCIDFSMPYYLKMYDQRIKVDQP